MGVLFFFPLFFLVLVLSRNIQTREKAMNTPGNWPPRDMWTLLWENWYLLEIVEASWSSRSISQWRRGRAEWLPKAAHVGRGAASEPGP